MSRISLSFASLLIVLWGLFSAGVVAQNRTSIRIEAEEKPELAANVEETVSRLLTEFNRAHYFGQDPDLSGQAVTDKGRQDILDAWNQASFRCPETKLTRSLVSGEGEGRFTLRSVPLLVQRDEQWSRERSAVFVVARSGQVSGFFYASERTKTRRKGSITVRTKPQNALVVSAIGGGTRKRSPARFEDVAADAYAFNVRKNNYRPVLDTTLTVEADQSVDYTIRLSPDSGIVRLEESLDETRLFVDGEQRSVSGGGIQLDAGSHRIRVSKKYHAAWDSTLTLSPGDTVIVDPRLHREEVAMIARSDPEGASVLVNGRTVGRTPIDTSLEAGQVYRMRLRKEGYIPSSVTRTVASTDSTVERRVVLTPVKWKSTIDEARLTNLRAERTKDSVAVRYAIVGVTGQTYRVDVDLRGPNGNSIDPSPGSVRGDVGAGLYTGSDKEIVLKDGYVRAATIRLTLDETGGSNRLLYVIGSAVAAVGGGTLAAILLRGGHDGGSSFPPPPGLPE